MIERVAEIIAVSDGQLRLRPERAACSGCETGCGGRCELLPLSADGTLWLPGLPHAVFSDGQRVLISIEDAELARAAWRGYGMALLGLLLGAGAGAALGQLWLPPPWRDAGTLIGLLLGTFLAARLSKRQRIEPQLRHIDPQTVADAPSNPS